MNRRSSTTISVKARANFKMVMVGERGVGKTSLLMRYHNGVFCKTYAVTIGIESFSKELVIDSQKVGLQIWDTAGQDGFKSMVKSFYSHVCCVIVAYSDPKQLKRTLEAYLKEVSEYSSQYTCLAVVRTKADLLPITAEEINLLDEYHTSGIISLWKDVSSKQGTNVQKFFQELSTQMLEKYQNDYDFKQLVSPSKNNSLYISKTSLQQNEHLRKSKCCGN